MSTISIFDLFSIGIGPSSSHTVGPMRAACQFYQLIHDYYLPNTTSIQVDLYGSLALTGKGHGTDKAILLGLQGELPKHVEPARIPKMLAKIERDKKILIDKKYIDFDPKKNLCWHQKKFLPNHANGMMFTALDKNQQTLVQKTFYSIGGGFIIEEGQSESPCPNDQALPYPFGSAQELLSLCKKNDCSIAELMWLNELSFRSAENVKKGILQLAHIMDDSITRGCQSTEKILPGGLHVSRRAPALYQKLINSQSTPDKDLFNWLNLYALAVNEENAAGGRIVTAPTNGAAGIIPATLKYFLEFESNNPEQDTIEFLLTAAAIAILYKKGASISAAEVGCQGEVGVACSMAAGALTAVLGGTLSQIEMAAEMGMEHHLGLTCDPVKGLVQIPCIERNAMGTIQAVNCARLALMEEGQHHISLDTVIATMLRTGQDMQASYKETALGGLAVNIPEC